MIALESSLGIKRVTGSRTSGRLLRYSGESRAYNTMTQNRSHGFLSQGVVCQQFPRLAARIVGLTSRTRVILSQAMSFLQGPSGSELLAYRQLIFQIVFEPLANSSASPRRRDRMACAISRAFRFIAKQYRNCWATPKLSIAA